VRLKHGYRFWSTLLIATGVIIPCLSVGVLIFERRANPAKHVMNSDLWSALPFIVLPPMLLLLAFRISIRDRRLVTYGEISMGRVTDVRLRRKRGPAITYEFLDISGRLITASSPDNTRSFSAGMVVPIFYEPESPGTDQVALCASFYEVAGIR
jgi:hypothetical protein